MESPDWESPLESPLTCDQPWKGKFDRMAGCIGALGGAGFESLVTTDLEVHLQMNSSRFETYDAMRAEVLAFIESRTGSRMTETKVHEHDKKSVMTRWIPILWSKAKARTSSQALATFVAKSVTRPQNVGQETELQTKVREEIPVRMLHLREKGKSVGQGTEGMKGHPKG